jgi:hypothetical protein
MEKQGAAGAALGRFSRFSTWTGELNDVPKYI